jgi:hypothetical protein
MDSVTSRRYGNIVSVPSPSSIQAIDRGVRARRRARRTASSSRIQTAVNGDLAAVDPLTDFVRALNASGNDVVGLYARHRVVAGGRTASNRLLRRRLHDEPGGVDFPVDAGGQVELFDGITANLGEFLGESLDVIEAGEEFDEVRRGRHARDSTDGNSRDCRQKSRDLSRHDATAVPIVRRAGTYVSLRARVSYRR